MKLQSRSRDEPEINVISLVDVLLVLVLFFMVSTTFLRETELSVRLPQATTDTRLDAVGDALEISVTQSGRLHRQRPRAREQRAPHAARRDRAVDAARSATCRYSSAPTRRRRIRAS